MTKTQQLIEANKRMADKVQEVAKNVEGLPASFTGIRGDVHALKEEIARLLSQGGATEAELQAALDLATTTETNLDSLVQTTQTVLNSAKALDEETPATQEPVPSDPQPNEGEGGDDESEDEEEEQP